MSTSSESFTCPSCSGPVLRSYERCPHCLKPKDQGKGPVLLITFALLGVMLSLVLALPEALKRSAKPELEVQEPQANEALVPQGAESIDNGVDYRQEVSQQIEDLNREIQENPREASLYIERGWCYQDVAKYELAYKDLSRAISLAPASSEAYCKRAWVRVSLGQFQAAVKDASEALALDKRNDEAHEARATAYMSLGEPDKAEADYQEVSR